VKTYVDYVKKKKKKKKKKTLGWVVDGEKTPP